jgi:hypothetical protein
MASTSAGTELEAVPPPVSFSRRLSLRLLSLTEMRWPPSRVRLLAKTKVHFRSGA